MRQITAKSALGLAVAFTSSACRTPAKPASDVKLVGGTVSEDGLVPALLLELDGSPCTAEHIGGGVILTAQHCFLATRERPEIRLSLDHQEVLSLSPGDFDLEKPAVASVESMLVGARTIEVPQPDLIAFVPRDQAARARLAKLPAFKLGATPVAQGQGDLFLAGYGLKSYADADIDGNLRVGAGGISDVLDLHYAAFWTKGKPWAGGAPGDSGGPLFSFDGEDVVLHGVASTIERRRDPSTGETLKTWTRYVRLDAPDAKQWLTALGSKFAGQVPTTPTPEPATGEPLVPSPSFPDQLRCKPSSDSAEPYVRYVFDFTLDEENVVVTRIQNATAASEEPPFTEPNWAEGPVTGLGQGIYAVPLSLVRHFELRLGDEPVTAKLKEEGQSAQSLICERI